MSTLHILHALAALVVLAEAINKLLRCDPLARGMCAHTRTVDALKALAWYLLALAAIDALIGTALIAAGSGPLSTTLITIGEQPTPGHVAALAGLAVLIVRTRIKEG
jgi:hypothetical protein